MMTRKHLMTTFGIALCLNACNPKLNRHDSAPLQACLEEPASPPAEPLPPPEPAPDQCVSMR